MKKTICFVASGSGGHIIPCLSLAEQYKKKDPSISFIFFTSKKKLDREIINKNPLIKRVITLSLYQTSSQNPLLLMPYLFSLGRSLIYSFYILCSQKPLKIISTGGVLSIPVCIAAKILKIPIELWELNAEPGKTIYFLARWANKINVCFKETISYFKPDQCRLEKYPLRSSIIAPQEDSTTTLPLTILILGGSQGSIFINETIKAWLITVPELCKTIKIIHQAGMESLESVQQFYVQKAITAEVFDYHDSLEKYYKEAHIIISRSGAGSLFEIVFFNKYCITIPLETASTKHQTANARAFAKTYPEKIIMFNQKEVIENPSNFYTAINTFIRQAIQKA